MEYRLLKEFERLFQGKEYRHRNSSLGDWVAIHLYEDLVALGRSQLLSDRVAKKEVVLNLQNRRIGIKARRGDATLGEAVPGAEPLQELGFLVARGAIATVEIGTEVKVLAKAMIKQIDRVINDLAKQVNQFRRGAGSPVCVAIVGINAASQYTSYEKDRIFETNGRNYPHPIQEAAKAEARIVEEVKPLFDELLVIRFRATNAAPYPFEWVDYEKTKLDYGAALVRISREYDKRFGSTRMP